MNKCYSCGDSLKDYKGTKLLVKDIRGEYFIPNVIADEFPNGWELFTFCSTECRNKVWEAKQE